MNVLVAGGAGYVGSVTVEDLINRGHTVAVLDDLSSGHRQAVHPEAAFIRGNVANEERVAFAVLEHDIEAVIHFATSPSAEASGEDPFSAFEHNTEAGLSFLKTLLRYGVRKFVFSSTATVFSQPNVSPIPEEAPVAPGNARAESLYLLERVLYWLNRSHGLSYVTLRYDNVAGASGRFGEDHRPETHLIPLALQAALGNKAAVSQGARNITVHPARVRDYLHVFDVAEAHVLALEALREGTGKTYHLSNERGFSELEVMESCRHVTGKELPGEPGANPTGDPDLLSLDSRRIRKDLGWRQEHASLGTIIASAWAWLQKHPDGYAS